ncbi:hypothetical protein IMSAGC013_02816 [Lachnospiraceae bacterium]|nr:hypothetical protein IMSAGC013_02816 [Lachnospiraceae bacterium]
MAYNKMFYWSDDDEAYITNVPALPGCMADGVTIEESLANADSMIEEWISFAKELGREIPREDSDMMESTNPTSLDVASYILNQMGAVDTWMLQKLVYYCQAWCLGIYKTEFINDTFKDYVNGPVNKRLFDTHKGRRIVRREDYQLTHSFSESEKRHMEHVMDTYGEEDGDTLRQYTHQERPWREAKGTLKDGESDNKDISNALMMEYYHN